MCISCTKADAILRGRPMQFTPSLCPRRWQSVFKKLKQRGSSMEIQFEEAAHGSPALRLSGADPSNAGSAGSSSGGGVDGGSDATSRSAPADSNDSGAHSIGPGNDGASNATCKPKATCGNMAALERARAAGHSAKRAT